MDTITQNTECIRGGNTYQEDSEKTYESHVQKLSMGRTSKRWMGRRRYSTTFYVTWSKSGPTSLKSFMHKVGSKDFVSNLHKFVLFPLMTRFHSTFHTRSTSTFQGTWRPWEEWMTSIVPPLSTNSYGNTKYSMFFRLDEDSKHSIISKGTFLASQLHFSTINLKPWRLKLEERSTCLLLIKMVFKRGGRRG